MQVICSERQFFGQIRQLEGISPETTDDELSVRSLFYARRLIDHVRNFGVELVSGPHINGTLATFRMSLKPAWDEDSVQERLNGLAFMAPVACSLDQQDVPAFCYEPMMRAAIQDQFSAFAPSLQRLTVGEIRPALENCARQLLSAPVAPPANEYEAEVQQVLYEQFLLDAGKGDQLRKEKKNREVEEYRKREEETYKAQQEAARDAEWNRNEY